MKLCAPLLLAVLGLCSHGADAEICPEVKKEITNFLLLPKLTYKIFLQKYNPPEAAVAAKLKVKDCVDKMSPASKLLIGVILEKLDRDCK